MGAAESGLHTVTVSIPHPSHSLIAPLTAIAQLYCKKKNTFMREFVGLVLQGWLVVASLIDLRFRWIQSLLQRSFKSLGTCGHGLCVILFTIRKLMRFWNISFFGQDRQKDSQTSWDILCVPSHQSPRQYVYLFFLASSSSASLRSLLFSISSFCTRASSMRN